MSVVLIGVAEWCPDAVAGPSILGAVEVIEVEGAGRSLHVVCARDADDWSNAPMDSIEWVAPRVIAFDDVLRACVEHNILPARFGTVFGTIESLLADVESRAESLVQDLSRFSSVDEYRLEISLERTSAEQSSSGLDYLKQRKNERESIRAELDRVTELVRESSNALLISERSERKVKASALATPTAWTTLIEQLGNDTVANVLYEGPLPPFHFVGQVSGTNDA